VVAHKSRFGVSDHPVCGTKVGFAEIFLMPQPPLLTRRGMRLAQTPDPFIHFSERSADTVRTLLLADQRIQQSCRHQASRWPA
jgi:hypothetical protein